MTVRAASGVVGGVLLRLLSAESTRNIRFGHWCVASHAIGVQSE